MSQVCFRIEEGRDGCGCDEDILKIEWPFHTKSLRHAGDVCMQAYEKMMLDLGKPIILTLLDGTCLEIGDAFENDCVKSEGICWVEPELLCMGSHGDTYFVIHSLFH